MLVIKLNVIFITYQSSCDHNTNKSKAYYRCFICNNNVMDLFRTDNLNIFKINHFAKFAIGRLILHVQHRQHRHYGRFIKVNRLKDRCFDDKGSNKYKRRITKKSHKNNEHNSLTCVHSVFTSNQLGRGRNIEHIDDHLVIPILLKTTKWDCSCSFLCKTISGLFANLTGISIESYELAVYFTIQTTVLLHNMEQTVFQTLNFFTHQHDYRDLLMFDFKINNGNVFLYHELRRILNPLLIELYEKENRGSWEVPIFTKSDYIQLFTKIRDAGDSNLQKIVDLFNKTKLTAPVICSIINLFVFSNDIRPRLLLYLN